MMVATKIVPRMRLRSAFALAAMKGLRLVMPKVLVGVPVIVEVVKGTPISMQMEIWTPTAIQMGMGILIAHLPVQMEAAVAETALT